MYLLSFQVEVELLKSEYSVPSKFASKKVSTFQFKTERELTGVLPEFSREQDWLQEQRGNNRKKTAAATNRCFKLEIR